MNSNVHGTFVPVTTGPALRDIAIAQTLYRPDAALRKLAPRMVVLPQLELDKERVTFRRPVKKWP